MKLKSLIFAAFTAIAFGTTATASTILHGTQLSFHHEFLGNQYWAEDFTVGPGVEIAPGPTNTNRPRYYTIDIENDRLTFEMGPYNFNRNRGFNGIVIRDVLDNAPSFLSGSIVSSTFSGTPGITVTADEIRIDFSTAGLSRGQTIEFEFEIAAIPLTSSFAFMAAGLGGLAVVRRKSRLKAA